VGCNADDDCTVESPGTWCNVFQHVCTPQRINGASMPDDSAHSNPVLNGQCPSNDANAAAQLVCASGACDTADDRCGFKDGDGPCNSDTGAARCRSGLCSVVSPKCLPPGGCYGDADCVSSGTWCKGAGTGSIGQCTAKIANGFPMDADLNHDPTLDG